MDHFLITLTTGPNRLNASNQQSLKTLFEILLNLTYTNYEIHFNIPFMCKKTGEEYIIPDWLDELVSEKFKIYRTLDYGSITKILPTILRINDPETIIITVDDDLIYIDGFIEYHLEKRKAYPDAALGFAGLSALDGSCHFCTTLERDTRVKILEGYKTVSYKRKFFDNDIVEFSKNSWSDDIVLSAYLGMKSVPKIVINYSGDTNFNPRVESFPVVGHLPFERGGCFLYRNENTPDNHEIYHKLGYLER